MTHRNMPIGSMYVCYIWFAIDHQYTPVMLAYIPYIRIRHGTVYVPFIIPKVFCCPMCLVKIVCSDVQVVRVKSSMLVGEDTCPALKSQILLLEFHN